MKDKTVVNKLREYWLNHIPLSVKDGLNIAARLDKVIDERDQYKEILDIIKRFIKSDSNDLFDWCEQCDEVNNTNISKLIKEWLE